MLRTNHKSGESSTFMSGPSMSAPPSIAASRIDQLAARLGGVQNKRRRALSVLEKHEICKKRMESKENEKMKLEEFARLFPGIGFKDPGVDEGITNKTYRSSLRTATFKVDSFNGFEKQ